MPVIPIIKSYKADVNPDRAVGILLPFNGNARLVDITKGYNQQAVGDIKPFKLSYSTEEQAITNMVNLLLTRKGERLMQPDFGSLIPEFVFELNSATNRDDLKISIEDDINFWLPYIRVNEVEVLAIEDTTVFLSSAEQNVVIRIKFAVTEIGANRTVTFFVQGDFINYEFS